MGNNTVSTAFTYDIQNRLRMINNPSSLGTKPFAMELQYNAPNVSGATAQYSGNISAVRWRHNGGGEQSYRYNYDSYSRLTDGLHSGSNNEQGITCDSNGNITALTRTGIQPAAMTYNSSVRSSLALASEARGVERRLETKRELLCLFFPYLSILI